MKLLLLCDEGANQKALAHKLHRSVPLSHIGLISPPRGRARLFSSRLASITVGLPLRRAWNGMMRGYQREYPTFPTVALSHHDGVNAQGVAELIERERFDLVLVSGTDLLRQPLINLITKHGRILNLHTGLSPYVRGGPNCTAWALAIGRFDLIGSTIMWIDAGIDSGDLVATERPPLTGRESLRELNRAVMDHAHDLYVWAVSRFVRGEPLPSVRQADIAVGRLFLSRHWTAARIVSAVWNFATRYSSSNLVPSEPLTLLSREEASGGSINSR